MIVRWSVAPLLLGLVSIPAAADEFTEYRIPPHRRLDWNATVQVDGNRSISGDASNEIRSHDGRGSAGTFLDWLADSDPVRTRARVSAIAQGRGSWYSTANRGPSFIASSDHELRDLGERIQVQLQHRRYPWAAPLGLELQALATGQYEQFWTDEHAQILQSGGGSLLRDESHSTVENWLYVNGIDTRLAVGWGRVRDATAVYEADVLESRLRETGALTRPLSTASRHRLVALLAIRDSYESHRERPARTLWKEVEEILTEDGALREGGLDARSVLRAGENHDFSGVTGDVLPRSPFPRSVGFFVGPLLSDTHQHVLVRRDGSQLQQSFTDGVLVGSSRSEFHSRFDLPRDEVYVGAQAEIERPLGMRWQASASSQVQTPVRSNRDGVLVSDFARLAYMVADRWVASAEVFHTRSLLTKDSHGVVFDDRWLVDYGVSASYYLEDHLALSLFLRENQGHDTLSGSGGAFQRFGSVLLAMTYRIMGRFDAPGVIPAETLRP